MKKELFAALFTAVLVYPQIVLFAGVFFHSASAIADTSGTSTSNQSLSSNSSMQPQYSPCNFSLSKKSGRAREHVAFLGTEITMAEGVGPVDQSDLIPDPYQLTCAAGSSACPQGQRCCYAIIPAGPGEELHRCACMPEGAESDPTVQGCV